MPNEFSLSKNRDLSDEVFDSIEQIHNIKLTQREKLLMHMYYGLLTIKIKDAAEPEDDNDGKSQAERQEIV